MRSDALRRRQALLLAARSLLSQRGREVPLEAVADEAGVGIATLYRNFSSRQDLISELTSALLADVTAHAQHAHERLSDPEIDREGAAMVWAEFIDHLVGLELGALTQGLEVEASGDLTPEVRASQRSAAVEVEAVLQKLRGHGLIRDDVGPLDVVLGLGLVTRPLPQAIGRGVPGMASRVVEIFVAGMRPTS